MQVIFGDGYSYEGWYIRDYVKQKLGAGEKITPSTLMPSPRTGEMVHPIMLPNHNLKQAISSHLDKEAKRSKAGGRQRGGRSYGVPAQLV